MINYNFSGLGFIAMPYSWSRAWRILSSALKFLPMPRHCTTGCRKQGTSKYWKFEKVRKDRSRKKYGMKAKHLTWKLLLNGHVASALHQSHFWTYYPAIDSTIVLVYQRFWWSTGAEFRFRTPMLTLKGGRFSAGHVATSETSSYAWAQNPCDILAAYVDRFPGWDQNSKCLADVGSRSLW